MQTIVLLLCLLSITHAATLTIGAILRDHTPKKNPDFENTIGDDRKIVSYDLGADGKPVYAHGTRSTRSVHSKDTFNQWYNDVSGVNHRFQMALTLVGNDATPTIYSYLNSTFFPLDGKGFGNEEREHNYHFTLESHSKFTYHGGEVFNFLGDDDVWVYINNKLVIDLGGIHSAESASVRLDELGLIVGHTYPFDFFFAERHTKSSELRIETTVSLECVNRDHCGVCEGDGQSCCTCDDGDPCTIDSCEVSTGACQTAPTCIDNDECTMDMCKEGVCSFESTFECEGIFGVNPFGLLAIVLYIAAAGLVVGVGFIGGKKAVEKYKARKAVASPPPI